MRTIKWFSPFILLLALGCNNTSSSRPIIGVSVLTLDNPFFGVIADNIRAEADKHGYDVEVVSGDKDVAKQNDQVKDFIVKQCVAIVLCPCDSKAIGPVIQEANKAGIPVFTTDIACLAPDAKVECHIATDNYGGGEEAGVAMIEALGEAGGKVVVPGAKTEGEVDRYVFLSERTSRNETRRR